MLSCDVPFKKVSRCWNEFLSPFSYNHVLWFVVRLYLRLTFPWTKMVSGSFEIPLMWVFVEGFCYCMHVSRTKARRNQLRPFLTQLILYRQEHSSLHRATMSLAISCCLKTAVAHFKFCLVTRPPARCHDCGLGSIALSKYFTCRFHFNTKWKLASRWSEAMKLWMF